MSQQIDPDVMYRIRSRGVERPAVVGNRLKQLVRDFVLARHDELSEDGEFWFPAGEVESLFPSTSGDRFVRERLNREPNEYVDASQANVEDDRKFPREPWYVARASNVAGPYDQVTVALWYEEGCLRDDDQIRPGLHAKWRPFRMARLEGLLEPPPANSYSVNAMHLVAEPPVWMGPPRPTQAANASENSNRKAQRSSNTALGFPIVMATIGAIAFVTLLLFIAWFLINLPQRENDPSEAADRLTSQPRSAGTNSMTTPKNETTDPPDLLLPLQDQVAKVGEWIEIPLIASNPFHQAELTFGLKLAPSTVTINENRLTWIPAANDAGKTHRISVEVTDPSSPDRVQVVSFEVEVMPNPVVVPKPSGARPVDAAKERVF